MAGRRTNPRMRNPRSGQAAIEFTLLYAAVILPMTFGLVYVSEMYWVWHSINELTRDGARYAATHCWQADSQNVISYMQSHIPVNIDQAQFQSGGIAQINVTYYSQDPVSGTLNVFSCDGDCSTNCVPDTVTVNVTNYEFRRFVSFLHLPPVAMPSFDTSVAIQSNGCDPEQNSCVP